MKNVVSLAITLIFFFTHFFGITLPYNVKNLNCTKDVIRDIKLPFNTTNFTCNLAWSSQGFILMYQQTTPKLWSFVLKAPDKGGYIAMAFSITGRMLNSDAVVGWLPRDNTDGGIVKQYYLSGYSSRIIKPDTGYLHIHTTSILHQDKKVYMAFQLSVETQPETSLLYAIGPLPVTVNCLPCHRFMIATTINYETGLSAPLGENAYILRKTHATFTILGWGVFVLVGVLIPRYFKHKELFWFHAHILIQVFGFFFGAIGNLTGLALEHVFKVDITLHKNLGIFIFILGCLQAMAIFIRPSKESSVRKYWNWYHHNVGRLEILLGVGNIFYGMSLAKEDQSWGISFGIFLGIFVLLSIYLEIRKHRST